MSDDQLNAILTLIESRLGDFGKKFDHFDTTLTNHVNASIEAVSDIKVLKNNQETITKNLQHNFDQHAEFYGLFKVIDKQPDCKDLVKNLKEDLEKEMIQIKADVKKAVDQSSTNKTDIANYKSSIRTLKIVFGSIISLILALIKLGVI